MRRLILTLALVAWAAEASAQFGTPTVTTSCASGCGTTDDFADGAMSVSVSVAAGDLLVLTAVHWRPTPRTVSSVVCGSETLTSYHAQATRLVTYAVRAASSCTTATITLSGASVAGADAVVALVVSGSVSPLTETGTSAGASLVGQTSHGSGTVTPSASSVLFIGWASADLGSASWTGDGDFTNTTLGSASIFGYRIQSSSSAASYDVTSADAETSEISLTAFEGTTVSASNAKNCLMVGVCE